MSTEAAENFLQAATLLHQRTLRGRPALDVAGNGRYARQLVEASEQCRDMRLAQGLDIEDLDVDRLQEINGADMAEAIAAVHEHLNMRE